MPDKHEPDPRFIEHLEWQLGSELRRHRASPARQPALRALKIAALMLGSVALGAAAMDASQQLQESWRRELLEARLEVQLQLARGRLAAQLDAIGLTREQVEQGVVSDRDLMYAELQIEQAEADAAVLESELEEIRLTGREPAGELSSPLVDGRDFVTERIQQRMAVTRRHLEVRQRTRERAQQQVDLGIINERELLAHDLVVTEAELNVASLAKQLEVRQAFLSEEITAVEAELRLLELEAESRVVLLDRRRQYFHLELERLQNVIDAGAVHPAAAAQMRTEVTAIDAELRLAQQELDIVRRELERRAAER